MMTSTPSTRRATHHGTCQLCGHFQLLPGGRLSNHGYAVKWSQFVGTCPGSKGRPFEQSTDLIEGAIATHTAAAAALRARAADLRATTDGTEIPLHIYVPATWTVRRSSHRWVTGTIDAANPDRVTFTDAEGKTRTESLSSRHGLTYNVERTRAAIVAWANGNRAAAFEAEAARHDQYVAWQRERIAGWAPADLKPRGE